MVPDTAEPKKPDSKRLAISFFFAIAIYLVKPGTLYYAHRGKGGNLVEKNVLLDSVYK